MSDRTTEITEAVRGFVVDIDDIVTIRTIAELKRLGARLQDADRDTIEIDELIGLIDQVLASVDGLLGDGAALMILGPRPKLTELIIAVREIFACYDGSTVELESRLADLTETVSED